MKKKYNPFKMWGSYVLSVPIFLYMIYHLAKEIATFGTCSKLCEGQLIICISCQGAMIMFSVLIVIGFLIGWGIHSLFRKLRK